MNGNRIIPTRVMIDLHGYDQDFVTTERALEIVIRAFYPEIGQLPATVEAFIHMQQLGRSVRVRCNSVIS